MISIDTDLLKSLTDAAQISNGAIHEAADMLNQVAVHNDWGCIERNKINEFTLQNKNTVKQLQEANDNFLHVIHEVLEEFEQLETNLPNRFDSIEKAISGIISIPTPEDASSANSAIVIKNIISHIEKEVPNNKQTAASLKRALDTIRIVNYNDIDLTKSGYGGSGGGGTSF